MDDLISRKGTAAWLEHMGYPGLANAVMDEKRFPSKLGTNLAEVGTRAVRGYPIDADALMEKVAEEYGERARDRLYQIIRYMPPAQPEYHEIGYRECADAVLKMWMDNVLTDGEHNRIIDKLNAKWAIAEGDAE